MRTVLVFIYGLIGLLSLLYILYQFVGYFLFYGVTYPLSQSESLTVPILFIGLAVSPLITAWFIASKKSPVFVYIALTPFTLAGIGAIIWSLCAVFGLEARTEFTAGLMPSLIAIFLVLLTVYWVNRESSKG